MEYLSTVFTNLQISGDYQRPLGDYLPSQLTPSFFEGASALGKEIILEIISENISKNISERIEISWRSYGICENSREILQTCPWNFIDPQLKDGMVRRAPGDSGEFLGEEIFPEKRFT